MARDHRRHGPLHDSAGREHGAAVLDVGRSASFPWFDGTVGTTLAVLSAGDPTHLQLRSEPGIQLNEWQYTTNCFTLTSGSDGSDLNSVSVTFTPVALIDGSSGGAATITKSIGDACPIGTYDVPAGEWELANATDNVGRPVWLSTDGITFTPSIDIGNNTHEGGVVYLGFAPPADG